MHDLRARVMPYIKPALPRSSPKAGETPALELPLRLSPVMRELGHGLLIFYLVDVGDSFEYVQYRHLDEAGLDGDALHTAALLNFRAFSADRGRIQTFGNIFTLFLDNNFEASYLLADWLWERVSAKYTPNGPVVAVPARDMLCFADAANAQGIQELREVIARVFPHGDHLISERLFHREAGAWVPYQPS
jgi:uncharacterized protein YtpQ (UPF0354 family)